MPFFPPRAFARGFFVGAGRGGQTRGFGGQETGILLCPRPAAPAGWRGLFDFPAASGKSKSLRKRAGFPDNLNLAAGRPYSAFALFLTSYIL